MCVILLFVLTELTKPGDEKMLLDQQITVSQLIQKLKDYPPGDLVAHYHDHIFVGPVELIYLVNEHGQHIVALD